MKRINNTGWPELIGCHVTIEGVTHAIADAYGSIVSPDGQVLLRCSTKFLTFHPDVNTVDGPLTCLKCLAIPKTDLETAHG